MAFEPQHADEQPSCSQPDISAGITHALSLIRARFEDNPDPDEVMAFHCVRHTIGVIRRTDALLRAMGATEPECELGMLAAAFHDTVQRWEPNATADGKVMRKRFSGQNETDSAAEAVEWMVNAGGFFRPADCDLVTQAILATIPGWDAENQTVSQPNLTPDSPPVARAVALSDLGTGGMDGAIFAMTGDQLFIEENLDIARALRSCKTRADLAAAVLERYKERMLVWSRSQVTFVRGRRARLETEMGDLSSTAKDAVRALFSAFDAAITAAAEVVTAREILSPWEVARSMGYTIPAY
jgi:hypothetical protein